MEGSKDVPSGAIFPFCLSNYAGEFINFQRYLKRNSFSLSPSLSGRERKRGRRKERRGKGKEKRGSVISNREKVLPQQTTSPPSSLPIPSFALSRYSLISSRPDCVSPTTRNTVPSLHQPRDRSST